MAGKLFLLIALSASILASTHVNAFIVHVRNRIAGRIVHFESVLQPGRWLWQSDYKSNGGYKLIVHPLPQDETYFQPKVQYKVKLCTKYFICFESLAKKNHYLAVLESGVRLIYSTSPETDQLDRFFWKVFCTESEKLEKCRIGAGRQIRNNPTDFFVIMADDKGWKAILGVDRFMEMPRAFFKIHAPIPTDDYEQIFSTINKGDHPQKAQYKSIQGITQTTENSHTLTASSTLEISLAFTKAFSGGASTTLESSWTSTSSRTWQQGKEVTLDLSIPPHSKIVVKQLQGKYDKQFTVGTDHYKIEQTKITKRTYIYRPRPRTSEDDSFPELNSD